VLRAQAAKSFVLPQQVDDLFISGFGQP